MKKIMLIAGEKTMNFRSMDDEFSTQMESIRKRMEELEEQRKQLHEKKKEMVQAAKVNNKFIFHFEF